MKETDAFVLLHGFGGTHHAWDAVLGELGDDESYLPPLALDLPGHGRAGALRPISLPSCVEYVLAHSPPSFALAGYSMGGRIALLVALAAPERVQRLALISTTAGITDARERAARRRADERLAEQLEHEPFELFIERWRAQPLFDGEPEHVREAARADQRRNEAANLAVALRGIGTGQMASLWERLGELEMPVAVLAGERDDRFSAIARRLVAALPHGELRIVAGGHALALENPAAVARALRGASARAGDGHRKRDNDGDYDNDGGGASRT